MSPDLTAPDGPSSGVSGSVVSGSGMRLRVIGCSGSFPAPDSAASCYLLQAADDSGRQWNVVLDLGNGALGELQRYVEPAQLDAVLISHLHPDHFMDLCGLYVALRYHPDNSHPGGLPLLGPSGTLDRVRAAYGSDDAAISEVYDVQELAENEPVSIGPFRIIPHRVEHPVLAYGLRVECGGAVLAYSGDTDACEALVELAKDADVLLAEASFVEGRDVVRGVHLTGRRAGEVATAAGVQRLVLTHIPVWTDAEVVSAEARQVFQGHLGVARPGLTIDIGAAR